MSIYDSHSAETSWPEHTEVSVDVSSQTVHSWYEVSGYNTLGQYCILYQHFYHHIFLSVFSTLVPSLLPTEHVCSCSVRQIRETTQLKKIVLISLLNRLYIYTFL